MQITGIEIYNKKHFKGASQKKKKKKESHNRMQWLMPVIPATWETRDQEDCSLS
jgi:hypothetical protein